MRITRDNLLRIARETVQQRAVSDPQLVAAYLIGSLLSPDPFLGNTTDIDLVLVHEQAPKVSREIVPLAAEIHLDILHKARKDFDKPKEFRVHPTLGPELYNPMWLYETKHFLEFVQAALRTKFNDPANMLARARKNNQDARQAWREMQAHAAAGPEGLVPYLQSLFHAGNAIAVLNGNPLTERRFLLEFPKRAEAAGNTDLSAALFGLLGATNVDADAVRASLPEWEKSFLDAASRSKVHESIAAPRLGYYKNAIEALLAGEVPLSALWPFLHTWTLSTVVLPLPKQMAWSAFCETLGLTSDLLEERIEGLDHFLDTVDEILDGVADSQGL
jgi:hypothetical protein